MVLPWRSPGGGCAVSYLHLLIPQRLSGICYETNGIKSNGGGNWWVKVIPTAINLKPRDSHRSVHSPYASFAQMEIR